MIDLTPAQAGSRVGALLHARESKTLDFKRISSKHGRMIETVCAFANSEGGLLVIGVGDAKELKPGAKPQSRLFGIEENPEGFDDFRRQILARFAPPIENLHWMRLPCTLHDGAAGHIVLLRVEKSARVHSVVGNGTWTRMDASNREMVATEIAELHYQRGVRSAVSETVPILLTLLETSTWTRFVTSRGLRSGTFAQQLQNVGLAVAIDGEVQPTRAAVLLFADEPGSLLAAHGSRADIRLMVYDGKQPVPGSTPNLRKAPKTIRGPLIDQIDAAVRAVLDELSQGLTLSGSGFNTQHVYPERVVKEAIVNAVIHRDYRLNRDIFIRIFDDRIEIESPGVFPANITAANIDRAGSKARNPLIAQNLREFPVAPNIDAGEGVKMMFAEMALANLYPPQYRQNTEVAVESVTVTLLNHERPGAWDEVSAWLDQSGSIANADVCRIAKVDTLKASKLLALWREQGLLVALPGRGKRNMAYAKAAQGADQSGLLSGLEENNHEDT
ncbi:ATP-binding protein [Paraburkholderia azotifigens]|uniref:ATP-binding protein n=1 Tax=Paraburkholderia azotifigens TaxID=2057004 RepID=UPI003177C4AB